MGISPSKRAKTTLKTSPAFKSACNETYTHCISLTQHSFSGILPYQLHTAATHLHTLLLRLRIPLILEWVPSPPSRAHIDSALHVIMKRDSVDEDVVVLGRAEFEEWAVELFGSVVVENAELGLVRNVSVVGIVGVGTSLVLKGTMKSVVGSVCGGYALGLVTWVYLQLGRR